MSHLHEALSTQLLTFLMTSSECTSCVLAVLSHEFYVSMFIVDQSQQIALFERRSDFPTRPSQRICTAVL